MSRIADFRHSAGKFAGSDLEGVSAERAGELSVSTHSSHPPIAPIADHRPCRVKKHGPLQAGATPLAACLGPAAGQPDVENFDTWTPHRAASRRAAPRRAS
jgi:hypothetical protein